MRKNILVLIIVVLTICLGSELYFLVLTGDRDQQLETNTIATDGPKDTQSDGSEGTSVAGEDLETEAGTKETCGTDSQPNQTEPGKDWTDETRDSTIAPESEETESADTEDETTPENGTPVVNPGGLPILKSDE